MSAYERDGFDEGLLGRWSKTTACAPCSSSSTAPPVRGAAHTPELTIDGLAEELAAGIGALSMLEHDLERRRARSERQRETALATARRIGLARRSDAPAA